MSKPQPFHETCEAAITARHADKEIAHLEKIVRFARHTDIEITSEPYWRLRIENLRAEPLLVPQQRARLDSLLAGMTIN